MTRVFISDGSGYVGAYVVEALAKADVGEGEEEGGHRPRVEVWASIHDGSAAAVGGARPPQPSSRIVKQLPPAAPSTIAAALECDVIVLNLASALVEGQAIVEALRSYIAALPPPPPPPTEGDEVEEEEGEGMVAGSGRPPSKTVIALSSALTWDRTTSVPQPWDESHYKRRRPGMKAADVRDAEAAVMTLSRPDRGVRCHVIAAGLPYGGGFGPLYPLLRRAWLCADCPPVDAPPPATGAVDAGVAASGGGVKVGLPVPCIRHESGKNPLPAIHVADLAAFTAKVAAASSELQPEAGVGEYFLAVDEGTDTLVEVCGAASKVLGIGGTRLLPKDAAVAFLNAPDAPVAAVSGAEGGGAGGDVAGGGGAAGAHLGVDSTWIRSAQVHLAASMAFDTGTCAIFQDARVALTDWHSRGGMVAGMAEIVAPEFRTAHDLRPVRIVVAGPPASTKTPTAALLAAKYGVPCIDAKTAVAHIRHGNLRALSDGTPERMAALKALREAIDKVYVEFDAAAAAAAAHAPGAGGGEKGGGKGGRGGAGGGRKAGKDALTIAAAGAADGGMDAAGLERGARLPRDLLVRAIRAHLTAPDCRNKGWVLDGFPRTLPEAKALFTALPDGDDGITPEEVEAGDGGVIALVGREERADDAAVEGEAIKRHIAIHVLGAMVAGAGMKKSGNVAGGGKAGDGGEEEGEEADGDDGGDADADALATTDLDGLTRPTAVITLAASDAWCEAHHLDAASKTVGAGAAGLVGHHSHATFLRRLRRYRLHNHAALLANPITWLEANARLESCIVDVEAAGAALGLAVPITTHGSHGHTAPRARDGKAGDEEDEDVVGVPAAVVATTLAAAGDAADADAALAARAARLDSVASGGSEAVLTLPADLATQPSAHATAMLHLFTLKRVAPFVHRGGQPANFHPTAAEVTTAAAAAAARAAKHAATSTAVDASLASEAVASVKANEAAARETMSAVARAEAALLETRTAPLRAYLLQHVIPHLTAGLVEVCKAGSPDPIAHLADLLLAAAAAEEASSAAGGGAHAGPPGGAGTP